MKSPHFSRSILTLLIGVSILTGYSFISAQTWTNAPSVPPTNNTPAPVHIGSAAQDKNGTFAANKLGVISNSPVLELIDGDAGQKDWRLGVEGGNSFVIRADRTNDLDAGEPTITWSDDGNYQMQLYNGADSSADYVQFSNQVRATTYCDRNGENCLNLADTGDDDSPRPLMIHALKPSDADVVDLETAKNFWNKIVEDTGRANPDLASVGWTATCHWDDDESHPTTKNTVGGDTQKERLEWCGILMCRWYPGLDHRGTALSDTAHCGSVGSKLCPVGRFRVSCLY